MINARKRKNLGVELARIIACLCVICIHVGITNRDDQGYIAHGLLIACLVADGVAVFWLITGLYWMNNDYLMLIKKTVKKIVIPMMICYLFSFYFADAVLSGEAFRVLESITRPWIDYKQQIKNFLEYNASVPYFGQFWYLYIYFLLVLSFPVMKSFVEFLDQSRQRIKMFLLVIGVLIIWNDLTANAFLAFSHHSLNALIPASIVVCMGHYINKYKDSLVRKQLSLLYFLAYLIVNVCRAYVINKSDGNEISYFILIYWFSLYGIICASCIVLGCMSFMGNVSDKSRLAGLVNIMGRNTFGIYLVHYFVLELVKSRKIHQNIIGLCDKITSRCARDICYWGIMTFCVFAVSLLIVVCIGKIIMLLDWMVKLLKNIILSHSSN